MRAILIEESLIGEPTPVMSGTPLIRKYHHELDQRTQVTIVELAVEPGHASELALEFSRVLKPELFYAHIVGTDRMLVVFPRTIVEIRRESTKDEAIAQQIGRLFAIPVQQMQFLAMFDEDHPDAIRRV